MPSSHRSPQRAAGLTFTFAVFVLLAAEVLRVYWIMPMPGSQQGDTLGAAYALHRWIGAVRILAGGAAIWAAARLLARGRWPARVLCVLSLALAGFVIYQTNGPMSADVMFRQPTSLTFASVGKGAVAPDALVVGVALANPADPAGRTQARAYPIQFIGYHHQVRDVVAGQPVAEGTNESTLTGRDSRSWQRKSWVVGVLTGTAAGSAARAFDWNELVRERVINDRVGGQPVLLLLGADGVSFQAFDARPGGSGGPRLELERTADPSRFQDRGTGATWDESGLALDGPQAGTRLTAIPAYQEFWHSWQDFRPATTARRNPAL